MTTSVRPPVNRENKMTLDAIHRGTRHAPDRILLVGVEGIGKSTFGASAPSPIFIASEDGIRHLDVASFPEPKTYADVVDAVTTLGTTEHAFKTLVIDTADWLEPLILDDVCQKNGWADIEAPGFGKGYVAAANEWRRFLLTLDRLRAVKGMEIIILAHATLRNITNPSGPDYSRYEGKLNKNALALVKEWTDVNLFAIHEEFIGKAKGELKAKASLSGRRIMHTQRGAGWDAKNRHGLPAILPLDYAEYAAAREAGRPASAESLRGDAVTLIESLKDETTKTKASEALKKAGENATALAKIVDLLRTKVAEQENA